jgi:hypothetical protein
MKGTPLHLDLADVEPRLGRRNRLQSCPERRHWSGSLRILDRIRRPCRRYLRRLLAREGQQ